MTGICWHDWKGVKILNPKCVLCDSEWGNHWETINGQDQFFCCALCSIEYLNLRAEIMKITGQDEFAVRLEGTPRGRICNVTAVDSNLQFFVRFDHHGKLAEFRSLNY